MARLRRGLSPIVAAALLLVLGLLLAIILGARIMQYAHSVKLVHVVLLKCAMVNESLYVCGLINGDSSRWFVGEVSVLFGNGSRELLSVSLAPGRSIWLGVVHGPPGCEVVRPSEGWICKLVIRGWRG